MKLLLLTVFIAVASAVPHWDEDGQYRILEDEPIRLIEEPIKVIEEPKVNKDADKEEPALEYYTYPYYRYYQNLRNPAYAAQYYQALADPTYEQYKTLVPNYYANWPARVQYKAYNPFVYNFKLVKDIGA